MRDPGFRKAIILNSHGTTLVRIEELICNASIEVLVMYRKKCTNMYALGTATEFGRNGHDVTCVVRFGHPTLTATNLESDIQDSTFTPCCKLEIP